MIFMQMVIFKITFDATFLFVTKINGERQHVIVDSGIPKFAKHNCTKFALSLELLHIQLLETHKRSEILQEPDALNKIARNAAQNKRRPSFIAETCRSCVYKKIRMRPGYYRVAN